MKDRSVWRVLLVDDDEDDYILTRQMLSDAQVRKFKVDWASNTTEGHKALQETLYDAVLVDYDLGFESGIEFIRAGVAINYPAPFILYTGRGSYEVDNEAMEAGATLYIVKREANPLLLERNIRYAIDQKHTEEALRQARGELERRMQERTQELEQVNTELRAEVSERKEAVNALRDRETLLAQVLESLPVGVWIIGKDGEIQHGNSAARQIWDGARYLKLEQWGQYKAWWPNGEPVQIEEWPAARVLREGQPVPNEEMEIETFHGKRKTIWNTAAPLRDPYNNLIGVIEVNQDITEYHKARCALEKASDMLEKIFNNLHEAVALLDRDMNFVRVNPLYAALDGRPPGFFPGKNHFELYPHKENEAIFRTVVETGQPYEALAKPFIYPENPDRGVTYWDWILDPVRDADGSVAGLLFTLRDVTTQKRTEIALAEANLQLEQRVQERTAELEQANLNLLKAAEEARTRAAEAEKGKAILDALMDSLPAGIAIMEGEDLPFDWVSQEGLNMVGVPGEVLREIPVNERTHRWPVLSWESHQPLPVSALPTTRAYHGEIVRAERFYWTSGDGRSIPIECSAGPIRTPDGKISGAVLLWQDITERKRVEDHLANHAMLLEKIHDAVIFTDREGRVTGWNSAAEQLYGIPQEQALGKDYNQLVSTELTPETVQEMHRQMEAQGFARVEYTQHAADGRTLILEGVTLPLRNVNGEITGYMGSARDITSRIQVERETRQRERQLRALFDHLPIGVWFADQEGRLVFGNPAVRNIWEGTGDFGAGEFPVQKGKGWWYDSGQPLQSKDWAGARAVRNGETSINEVIEIECFNGRHKIIHNSAVPVRDEEGRITGAVILNEDITEQMKAQHALHKSEERFRAMFEISTVGQAEVDPQTYRYLTVNSRLCEITGYSREELVGMSVLDLTHPEDRAADQQRYDEAMNSAGTTYTNRKRYIRKDGDIRWVDVQARMIKDEKGRPLSSMSVILDVTDQIKAEEAIQRYVEQLTASNRELEEFAFVASHDLQEPLRKIESFSDLLDQRLSGSLPDVERDYLNRVKSAATRMRRMIEDLLALSRVRTRAQSYSAVDLNEVIRSVLDDLEVRINTSGGRVEAGSLPVIRADEAQIRQLMLNLVNNALKFHREGVPPLIQISSRGLPGKRVEVTVQDNGIGFEMRYIERIFQPFQRLNERGRFEGTGMGLAICRKIVERHHGTIAAESQPGEGSRFIITLPVNGMPDD